MNKVIFDGTILRVTWQRWRRTGRIYRHKGSGESTALCECLRFRTWFKPNS